jgi:hypothetical protein
MVGFNCDATTFSFWKFRLLIMVEKIYCLGFLEVVLLPSVAVGKWSEGILL